ncbi:hypothetical protein [Sphingobacterium psychroaquaticum]|uniref:Uncharacterized protein n=1 Tax=Sphingobacterium psychroaquaticum TaxID=561061 RepID=A0A1X7JX47_9SPHI|nr:hypothetical protein [Sphingobacterium psychroaquaticum]QBQ41248.1 hypothetical protein E2P86_08790 [Sphingobacterium psychroaquaticum]SMG32942.1 hypothetical protein SAMN05660862_2299 [Sphingobacterium psychroaquaticum]
MKKYFYAALVMGLFTAVTPAQAQLSVSVNIGAQPQWGPVGYDYVRYYYIPEIDVYYDVSSRKYTYYQGNRWVTRSSLPRVYGRVDLYRTYKVVINDRNPWHHHGRYKKQYGHYAHNHSQHVLRDYHKDHRKYEKYEKKRDKHERKAYEKHRKHYDRGRRD